MVIVALSNISYYCYWSVLKPLLSQTDALNHRHDITMQCIPRELMMVLNEELTEAINNAVTKVLNI